MSQPTGMAGAALRAEDGFGPMNGPMGPKRSRPRQTTRPRLDKITLICSYFAEAADGTRTHDLLHGNWTFQRTERASFPVLERLSRRRSPGVAPVRDKVVTKFVRGGTSIPA